MKDFADDCSMIYPLIFAGWPDGYDIEDCQKRVTDAFHSLPQRDQYVLSERRLTNEPQTLKSIAEELGISAARVSQIERRAIYKIKRHVRGNPTVIITGARKDLSDVIESIAPTETPFFTNRANADDPSQLYEWQTSAQRWPKNFMEPRK